MTYDGLNYFAIILAALLSTILCFFWYRQSFESYLKLVWVFILCLIIALVMANMIEVLMFTGGSLVLGLIYALILGLGFICTTIGVQAIINKSGFKKYLKDAGFMLLAFLMMGAILGSWQ